VEIEVLMVDQTIEGGIRDGRGSGIGKFLNLPRKQQRKRNII